MATYTTIVDPGNEQSEWSTDYTSLSAWEAGEQTSYSSGDIAIADCRRSTSTKDTTAVTIDGWTSGVVPKIQVHADCRHEGKWADQQAGGNYVYTLSVGNYTAITIQQEGTVIEGLQVEHNASSNYRRLIYFIDVGGEVSACLGQSAGGVGAYRVGVYVSTVPTGKTFTAINNVFDGLDGSGFEISTTDSGAGRLYNNTVYGCAKGITTSYQDVIAKNNGCFDNSSLGFSGTFHSDSDYNVSSDSTAIGTNKATGKTSYSDYFVDHSNGDFHLKDTSYNLWGINSSNLTSTFTVDIDGDTRADSNQFGIGADYYTSSGTDYTLTASSGSMTLTGQSASLLFDRILSAGAGSVALTGQAASLLYNRLVSAGAGSYTLTGQAAALLKDSIIAGGSGSVVLGGQDVSLLRDALLAAEAGAYTLTGQDASLLLNRLLSADAGSVALTGYDVTLTYTPLGGYTLSAESGSFTLTGSDASLLMDRKLAAGSGSITLDGQTADLLFNRLLASDAGSFTITGTDAEFLRDYQLAAAGGSITLNGQAVTLDYSGEVLPDGTVSITFTVKQPSTSFSVSAPSTTFTVH